MSRRDIISYIITTVQYQAAFTKMSCYLHLIIFGYCDSLIEILLLFNVTGVVVSHCRIVFCRYVKSVASPGLFNILYTQVLYYKVAICYVILIYMAKV